MVHTNIHAVPPDLVCSMHKLVASLLSSNKIQAWVLVVSHSTPHLASPTRRMHMPPLCCPPEPRGLCWAPRCTHARFAHAPPAALSAAERRPGNRRCMDDSHRTPHATNCRPGSPASECSTYGATGETHVQVHTYLNDIGVIFMIYHILHIPTYSGGVSTQVYTEHAPRSNSQ